MKKISFLLAVLLLIGSMLAVFSACEKEPENVPEETNERIENNNNALSYVADSLPENDFGEDVVTILTTDWRETPKYLLATEYDDDPINCAMVDAYYEVCSRFNLDIVLTVGGGHNAVEATVNQLSLSGDKSYDIVYNHDLDTVGNAIKGSFLNIKSLDHVDLEKPWWTRTSQDLEISDKLYFTSSYFGTWTPYMNVGLYYNKELAEDLTLTIPYDDIIAGEWYMEDLIRLTQDVNHDEDGDSDMDENDRYGFVTTKFGNITSQANLLGTFILKEQSGSFIFDKKIEQASSYMSIMERLYTNGCSQPYFTDTAYNIEIFKAGRALFWYGETRVLLNEKNNIDFKWAMLPFPKLNEVQKEYSSAGYDLLWGVNRHVADRSEIVSTVIEALSCQNYNYTIPAIWEDFLGLRLADAPIDSQMVAIVRDAAFVSIDYIYADQIIGMSSLMNLWDETDATSVASHVTSNASLAEVAAKLLISKIEKLTE